MARRRASSSEAARKYRQAGHDDALLFALEIGLEADYKARLQAKKDVVDLDGNTHSVKSGQKKWQIFLYRRTRFQEDEGFQSMPTTRITKDNLKFSGYVEDAMPKSIWRQGRNGRRRPDSRIGKTT